MESSDQINKVQGARAIFNGLTAEKIFDAENIPLPELAPGEILVKVNRTQ